MATTRTVTSSVVTGIRTNDDGSVVKIEVVTYSDGTTDTVETFVDRLIP